MATRSRMTEEQLLKRDAKRDIGAELLLSVRQMKAGKGRVVARVEVPALEPDPIASQSRHARL